MTHPAAQDLQSPRPKLPRRGRRLALAGLVLVALAGLLLLLRGPLLGAAGPALAKWAAARFAGYEVEIDRLRGDPLSWLEMEGLSAKPLPATEGDPAAGVGVTAERLRLDYSWRELWRSGLPGLHRVRGSGVRIAGEVGAGEQEDAAPWPESPAYLPELDLEAVTVDLGLGDGLRLGLDGASVRIERGDPAAVAAGWQIEVGGARLVLELPGEDPPPGALDLALVYRPELARVERLSWGELGLEPGAEIDLSALPRKRLDWRATLTSSAGPVITAGHYSPEELSLTFETAPSGTGGLDLARLPRWLLPAETPALAGTLAGKGEVVVPWSDAPPHVGFEGVVAALRVGERSFGRVEAAGTVDGAVIEARRLEAVSIGNRVELTDARLDLGAESWEESLIQARGTIEAAITDLPALLGQTAGDLLDPATGRLLRRAPEHRLELSAGVLDGTVSVSRGHLTTPGGQVDLGPSTIRFQPGEQPRLTLAARLDFSDLAPLGQILGTEPWSGRLRAEVEAAGVWPALRGTLEAEGEEVAIAGWALGRVRARAQGDGRRLDFDSFSLAGPWGTLDARGGLLVAQRRLEGVAVEAAVSDVAALAPGLGLSGSLKATATLDGTLHQLEGVVDVTGDGRYGEDWTLDDLRLRAVAEDGLLRLEELEVTTPLARLRAAGTIADAFSERPEALLEELVLEAGGKDLVLHQPARLAIEASGLAVDDLELRGSAGTLVADLTHRGGVTRWRARLEGFDPMPFAGAYLPADLVLAGVDGTVEGSLAGVELEATSTGSVARVSIPGVDLELRAAWQGSLAGRRLHLDRLRGFTADGPLLDLEGEVPFDLLGEELLAPGPVTIRGTLTAPVLDRLPLEVEGSALKLSGRLGAVVDLQGTWASLEGNAQLEGEGVELEIPKGEGTEVLGPGALAGRLRIGDGLLLEALTVELPDRARLSATGRWGVPTGPRAYLEPDAGERLRAAPLELDVTADAADLSWVSSWLPGVRRFGGRGRAQLEIRGTAEEPKIDGWAELERGELRLDDDVASLDALAGRVRLRPGRIEIERLTGELGAAPVRVTGSISLDGDSPGLDLELSGENVLLVRDDDLRLRADLALRIDGTLAAPRARGEVGLRNSRVFYRVDFTSLVSGGSAPATEGGLQLFSFTDPPLSETVLDLHVYTIDPVTISSNVARGGARLDLQLTGTGEVPLPRGSIFLDSTKVRLPSGAVDFTSGTVVFTRTSPFDPELALSGEARLRGYDVTLQVTGSLSEPEVLLSSTPPLANDQLLLLVLTGQTPATSQPGLASTAGGSDATTQAAQSVALYLARDVLSRWTGQGWEEGGDSFLDRLELVVGRELSESGSLTTEAIYLLREKYPSDESNLYLVAERDAFDAYNYGLRLVFRFQ